MNFSAQEKPKQIIIKAKVTRADGTVEELGTIAAWHRNPLKRWWQQAKIFIRRNHGNSSNPKG